MPHQRPTLDDVARAADVHKATASRALNPETADQVSTATAERVRSIAERLGYTPNRTAQLLRGRQSSVVGVVVPDLADPAVPPFLVAVQRLLADRGYTALLVNTDRDAMRERAALHEMVGHHVAGMIVSVGDQTLEQATRLAAAGTPTVLLTADVSPPAGDPGMAVVDVDLAGGIDALFDLLVGDGHRRIAHLAGPSSVTWYRRLAALHRSAVAARGLDPAECPVVEVDAPTDAAGAAATADLLDRHPDLTAVTAAADVLAVGALRAAGAAGRSCPADLSIAGFGDQPLVADLVPPLTTVRVPSDDVGRVCAELLLAFLDAPARPERRSVPVTLQVRASTGPATR